MTAMRLDTAISNSILDEIGNTPLIRARRLEVGLGREIYLKLEHLNPGGSHKVRIALNMIQDAERRETLRRGSGQTIVEPTGGNLGIGLAMAAALLGYRLVLALPDNYSQSKQRLLRAYGADIRLSDHRTGNDSHTRLAAQLAAEHRGWVMLNQLTNPANPEIHYRATAAEIMSAFGGNAPDALVTGIGTGGHLTGVGEALKEANHQARVVAVVPHGCSFLAGRFVPHQIQGVAIGMVRRCSTSD